MKKSLLNLGRALNRNEQKTIKGGVTFTDSEDICAGGGDVWNGIGVPRGCECTSDSQCGTRRCDFTNGAGRYGVCA
ncbi:hypothetical protein M0D21_19735 [Aquimarina sp. D1M17]|uniref:hypothetical protein n=1 Tax=Aquimarina acroporae TaxID=2937283 RepID=UPI0020C05726|nr:hypothetical protein [Aquimarina acroporae]MCK8523823.1 hypothetical protein [Aquimarina acroporae]